MKIIVTGSREWEEPYHIWTALDLFTSFHKDITIVHGHCPKGADKWADKWCDLYHANKIVSVQRYPADWDKYKRAAGHIRNEQMVYENLDADYVLAFPLGESRGTRQCMKYAKWMGLNVINLGEKLDD